MLISFAQPEAQRFPSTSKLVQYLYLYVAPSRVAGFGLFSARPFPAGSAVLRVHDPHYTSNAKSHAYLTALGYTHAQIFQVAEDAFIPPIDAPDDFTNHSCEPNCGLRVRPDGFAMIALKDIAANDELTYDYSTHQEHPLEDMVCQCGTPRCRGVIRSFSQLPSALQQYYLDLDIVADFAARAVRD